jgi:hypothetical protein
MELESCPRSSKHKLRSFSSDIVNVGGNPNFFAGIRMRRTAEKTWRRLDGQNQLPEVILNVKFSKGIEVAKKHVQAAA